MFNGNMREASDYESPAGSFGDIKLIEPVTVNDTGVSDYGFNLQLNYNITNNRQASLKYAFYNAKNAGFGFVEPELFNPGTPRIQILYHLQKMQTYTLKYEDKKLDFFLADHLGITGYYRNNERELENNIFVPFNIPMMPQAGININSENFTDVETLGFRLELSKAMGKHMLTYGTDFFRDNSENTDIQKTQIKGAGPPQTDISTTPQVPNAIYQSFGIFCQNYITLISRTSLILGLRYQNVNARTKQTEGLEGKPILESTDQTFVGTANLIYGVTDQLRLVLSVGRGFRSPNLIERFFNGFTPDGSSYQSPNPGLKAETSLNVDAGFKYRLKGIYLESTRFSNIIYDGIRIDPTGIKIHGLPEYKNINVDKLRVRGFEILGRLVFNSGFSFTTNFTSMKSKDLGNTQNPYGETYGSKLNFILHYTHPKSRFWMTYHLRINGKQKDVVLENNPIGPNVPDFSVHSVSGGIALFPNSQKPIRLGIIVNNLFDKLYTEFSNASFFRPAPGRHIALTCSVGF